MAAAPSRSPYPADGHIAGREELAVSTVGRMVGWIAHAMEQYQGNEFFRPGRPMSAPCPLEAFTDLGGRLNPQPKVKA
jgi:hypothetical protein